MAFPVRKLTRQGWIILPLTALALALGVGIIVKKRQLKRLEALSKQREAMAEDPRSLGSLTGERLSESLLTDSILSIVQSYYVDPERVDNKRLLLTALDSLSSSPRIKTGSSPGSVWVEIDGERKIFPLKEQPRYQDVLDVYGTVARMLDDAKVELVTGETPEKGASGSVSLLNSMLAELDAHSALLSPDAYKELRQGTEGAFGGLGVLVGIRDNLLTVIKPLPRSPAQRAGIKKHDRILGIDGMFTYGYSLDDLVEYMRGDPGTDVQLSLLREGANAPSEMTLKREVIQVDSVSVDEIEKKGQKVLHLTIENFASRTSREVLNAIKKYKNKNGGVMHGLVLDLRSNPGGLLDQAVQVADLFLQTGVIVTTKGRREEIENAGSGFDEVDFPMVVLVDGDSASASEIVAGALQDHGRALVIGQPSFGKGSVQTIFELPGDRALKLTIARYYTPGGYSIQNVGIIPDIWMQPVGRHEANYNLLGPYRYKNERFLHHHLDYGDVASVEEKVRQPSRKAYYLTDRLGEEDQDEPRFDQEMDLALKVIGKIHQSYGNKLPQGTGRASHWLGLAGPVINDTLNKLDDATSAWLKTKFGVTWTAPTTPLVNPDLKLHIGKDVAGEVTAGETLRLPWTVENKESFKVEKVSVFVRSDVPGFETKEVLIGELPAHGARNGTFEIPIPPYFEPGMVTLRLGTAVDAWPVKKASAEFVGEVLSRSVADLVAKVELDDAGAAPGQLEPKEKAKLKIDLKNVGQVAATNVKLRVVNLSGNQVEVMTETLAVPAIEPNDHQTVYVSVTGGKTLYSPDLSFGVYVESPDMRTALRQRNVVKGKPNGTLPQVSKLTSH